LDLETGEKQFADKCFEAAHPLIVVWGDSTAASLMPGLRDLQSRVPFGLVQLTANNCAPITSLLVSAACRENNDRVLSLIDRIRPDTVLLHASAPLNKDTVEGWHHTVTSLLQRRISRVVVLGPVPAWKRGLPGQMLSYYITHRTLLPLRSSDFVYDIWDEAAARSFFVGKGAEYVSAWQVLCGADGCLTRVNEGGPLTARDRVHLTEEGSALLIRSIADKLLQFSGELGFPSPLKR
jgi:hypothetical protein